MDAIAKIARLFTNGWGRAGETNSKMPKPETKSSGDLNGESTTRREVAQQEVGINIQTGEHPSVCPLPFSSYNL
jgi:hypothetical protein